MMPNLISGVPQSHKWVDGFWIAAVDGERMLSAEMAIHREEEQDESVIDRVVAAQWEELEAEIETLNAEAEQIAGEARELAGEVPF